MQTPVSSRPSHGRVLLGAALACAALCASARPARAYDEKIHVFIARRALQATPLQQQAAPPIGAAAVKEVLRAIDAHGRGHSDAAVRAEWTRRYPQPERFDSFAMKELLLLNPREPLYGFDRVDDRLLNDPLDQKVSTLLDLVVRGSREPDDDGRNRERLALDERRQPIKDGQGQPVPADPALLNMGKLGALSSQAHAHYGLAALQFSEDPEVLKTEPRRFAVASSYKKGPVLTLAAEMAQSHLDLALLASLCATPEGAPAGRALTHLYTGQAFHYLEDVSNQVHTVQVGLYDFFVDAFKARLMMSLRTGGGYLGPLRSLSSIGIDILTNHHTLSEALARKRVLSALAGHPVADGSLALLKAPEVDNADLTQRMDRALTALGTDPARQEFGAALTRAMIEVSSFEGEAVYRSARDVGAPLLRREGVSFPDQGDPDGFIQPFGEGTRAAYERFFALQTQAFSRAGTALRRWMKLQDQALASEGAPREALRQQVLDRLVRRQLKLLGEAEARRADYLKDPPHETVTPERMPAVLAAEILLPLLLLGGAALLLVRRRRAALSGGRAR